MRTSRSSTSAVAPETNYQILALSPQSHHSREGSLVPTTLHHHYNHLVPFLPCPRAIPQYPPPISIWTHRFSTLPHGIAGCPAPATTRLTACAARRGSPTWVGALIPPVWAPILLRPLHVASPDPAHSPISVGAYPQSSHSVPRLLRGEVPISDFNQHRRHLRRRVPRVGGVPHARQSLFH